MKCFVYILETRYLFQTKTRDRKWPFVYIFLGWNRWLAGRGNVKTTAGRWPARYWREFSAPPGGKTGQYFDGINSTAPWGSSQLKGLFTFFVSWRGFRSRKRKICKSWFWDRFMNFTFVKGSKNKISTFTFLFFCNQLLDILDSGIVLFQRSLYTVNARFMKPNSIAISVV